MNEAFEAPEAGELSAEVFMVSVVSNATVGTGCDHILPKTEGLTRHLEVSLCLGLQMIIKQKALYVHKVLKPQSANYQKPTCLKLSARNTK